MPDDAGRQAPKPEPVFNPFKRKIHRPFYSSREVLAGIVIMAALMGVTAWVVWSGAHPEPGLFQVDDKLLADKGPETPVYKRPREPWVEPGTQAGPSAPAAPKLGIFPAGILDGEWKAVGPVREFDQTNVYEKIDGREGFYKALGFQRLHFLSLGAASTKDLTIDIELFDMGTAANALGALTGEISKPDTRLEPVPAGFGYASANSGFVTQGRFYIRMVGSDDTDAVRRKIAALRSEFAANLPGEKLPWAYALFAGNLGLQPSNIEFTKEDAFSIGGATDVYTAKTGGDSQVFVSRRASADEAMTLAAKFVEGFKSYDQPLSPPAGAAPDVVFLRNEYAGGFDVVAREGSFVLGARLFPDAAAASQWVEKLRAALKQVGDLPPMSSAEKPADGDAPAGH